MITRITGIMLIAAAIGVATLQQAQTASAQTPQTSGVAVSATVNTAKTFTLTSASLSFSGDPGGTVTLPDGTCANITANASWTLSILGATSYFQLNNTDLTWFPIGLLSWQRTGGSGYTQVSTSQAQITTGSANAQVCLNFQLAYPSTATPGTYSTVINLILA